MKHYLYKLTDPNGKTYIGVTMNFKRRMKEHRHSDWPIGHAIRKYGEANFTIELEEFETKSLAFEKEFELVTFDTLGDGSLYNITVGGTPRDQMLFNNPMQNIEISANHPNLWTTEHNPMNSLEVRQKMVQSQKLKAVSIDGIEYFGVREAARQLGISRQLVVYRLKADNFPSWNYM